MNLAGMRFVGGGTTGEGRLGDGAVDQTESDQFPVEQHFPREVQVVRQEGFDMLIHAALGPAPGDRCWNRAFKSAPRKTPTAAAMDQYKGGQL